MNTAYLTKLVIQLTVYTSLAFDSHDKVFIKKKIIEKNSEIHFYTLSYVTNVVNSRYQSLLFNINYISGFFSL